MARKIEHNYITECPTVYFQMTMNKITLKIYADPQMNVEIATWMIDEDLSHNLYLDSQENDLLDGEDWWEECVVEIEEKYGESWNCFEIISSNGNSGRILERDYCVNYQKPKNYFSWVSKLYLFGDTSWGQLEKTFDVSVFKWFETDGLIS